MKEVEKMELGGKPIPKPFEQVLVNLRDRVNELKKQYGSLARWGRPYFFSVEEVAVVVYVNEKLNVSLDRLARFIGVDKTSLYKVLKRAKDGRISVFNKEENKVETKTISFEELLAIAEEKLEAKAKSKITDPFQSTIIRNFWEKDIPKRAKIAGKPAYLNLNHKKETLRVVQKLMVYFKDKNYPTNPDMWEEKEVEKALWEIYKDYRKVANAMIALRRVPEWRTWFDGKIGAVTKRINPQLRALFYEDYLKLKKLWKNGTIGDEVFLVIWLHLTTGAREGYTLYSENLDLDNEEVKSSLVGLRWENLAKVGDTYILRIYESKTEKWWSADLTWLDPEPLNAFLKYKRDKGSIIKSITGLKTVGDFKKWYTKILKAVSQALGLPYKLVPHDLRRSHLSILAELGVPMEYAISGHMDFGVGWEDAKTAVVFYLRFSKYTKKLLMERISEVKKKIEEEALGK